MLDESHIRLRPGTPADLEFICRAHRESMRPHVERVFGPWHDDEQRRRLYETTDPATHQIIEVGGKPVGCQWIREHPQELELVRLYLLPEVHDQGIGSWLVARLCARADAQGLPIRLRVLRGNPARNLYARQGFEIAGETGTHVSMSRPARPKP